MHKKPETPAIRAAFQAIFTTQRLVQIIMVLTMLVAMEAYKGFG